MYFQGVLTEAINLQALTGFLNKVLDKKDYVTPYLSIGLRKSRDLNPVF